MKVAVLLGVSSHKNPQFDLPACKNDVEILQTILRAAKKFDEILVISENEPSGTIKGKISAFFKEKASQNVDEILFYFSGHGIFDGNDFYFVLPEYEESQKRQTCLENSELDTYLKNLKAKLTVKIVDACFSGQSYIKDPSTYEKFLAKSQGGFEDCYFLYSSLRDQTSKADSDFSCFTKEIFRKVYSANQSELRYKDLIDYLSDSSIQGQTPFFVTQAKFTEVFLEINPEVKALLKPTFAIASPPEPKLQERSLFDALKMEAKRFVTKETALNSIQACKGILENYKPLPELESLYHVSLFLDREYDSLPNKYAIGKWLSQNPNNVFADPTYSVEEYEAEVEDKSSLWAITRAFGEPYPTKMVKKKRSVIEGFSSRIECQIKGVEILFAPKLENLKQYSVFFVFLLSKTTLYTFASKCRYIDYNWDKRNPEKNFEWQLVKSDFIDPASMETKLKNYLQKAEEEILEEIKKILPQKVT